jgi:hypothetical protein
VVVAVAEVDFDFEVMGVRRSRSQSDSKSQFHMHERYVYPLASTTVNHDIYVELSIWCRRLLGHRSFDDRTQYADAATLFPVELPIETGENHCQLCIIFAPIAQNQNRN